MMMKKWFETWFMPAAPVFATARAQGSRGAERIYDPLMFLSDEPETVEAGRRRKGSGPSGRAEAPGRPSSGAPGGTGGTSGGGFGGMLNRAPGGKRGLPVGLVLLFIVIFLVCRMMGGGELQLPGEGEGSAPQQDAWDGAALPAGEVVESAGMPTSPPKPTRTPSTGGAGSGETWTVMLYQDADDQVLEQDIYIDLNEAERIGSSPQVNIVAQMDRYAGGFSGDGDWTGVRRYYLTRDRDLNRINSELVADLGEVSMSDPATLVDFVIWAVETYPADKYALILSDHGMGWPGGWTDPKPSRRTQSDAPLASAIQTSMLLTNQIDAALQEIRNRTGLDKFELIGMDACLMSHVEVYAALAPYANAVVSSQETEPALGWAYAGFLQELEDNPSMDGAALGRAIVESYIAEDERIVDDEARADYLRQGSPLAGLFGGAGDMDPRALTRQLSKAITLSAADMNAYPALEASLNRLALALQTRDQTAPAKARTYAQSYTSIFGRNVPPSYIDLGNFVQILYQESGSEEVRAAAKEVFDQLQQVIIAEKHGQEKSGSNGLSIYFPNSALYRSAATGPQSYVRIADRFAQDTLWDDFLAFHYTNAPFSADTRGAALPPAGARFAAPGEGQIEASPLELSATAVNYDEPVTMLSTLKGRNIGYVYLFVGYFDAASQSILIADQDYLEAPRTKKVGDLFYPDWSDDETFNLKYTWTPSVFSISDGEQTVMTWFRPESYGATAAEAVYSVDGVYTFADGGDTQPARLYFQDGSLRSVFGFTGAQEAGAPREIIPQAGDRFTLTQTWLEGDGQGGYRAVQAAGETLTFGSATFTWVEQYAAAGDYVLGFVVSDLDGNQKQVLGQVEIK